MKKSLNKKPAIEKRTSVKFLKISGLIILILFSAVSMSLLLFNSHYAGRMFPNIKIASIDVGGLTPEEAFDKLESSLNIPSVLTLKSDEKTFDINSGTIDLGYDFDSSINRALSYPRTGNFFYDTKVRLSLIRDPADLGLTVNYNDTAFMEEIEAISEEIEIKPVYPAFILDSQSVTIERGSPGTVVNIVELKNLISAELAYARTPEIVIPKTQIDPSLNDSQVDLAVKRANKFVNKTIELEFEYININLIKADLFNMLDPTGGVKEEELSRYIEFVSSKIDRDPQNAKFQFDGNKVTEFSPALEGIKTDTVRLKELLVEQILEIEADKENLSKIKIPVKKTKPEVTTGEVNNLGIKELIGRGTSTYFHSIPGRVFNVNLAASRVNGAIIKPGETFSFNSTLGDVSKLTGYKEAYIISNGRTILGDGGGVCQVSTTLFRAVLNAGLPVDERSAHAYRVSYYEQGSPPGLDATVYSPRPDFKFTNNTDNHILIQAINDPKNYSLVFELYGTGDGRVATISKPITTNYSAPLPTVYQDDPTLPAGTLKQTDFAASGARVTFNYSVKKKGEEIYNKTFISNYRPWASVYLKGTGPVQ